MSMHQFFSRISEPAPFEGAGRSFSHKLLEPLFSELEFLLTGIALTGSIVNGFALNRMIQRQYSAITFLPPEPLLWSRVLLDLYGDEFSNVFGDKLIELERTLFEARKSTVDTFASTIRGASTFALDWRPASNLWRQAAREASEAYQSGLSLASDFTPRDFEPILVALSSVETGESPLVTDAGEVVVPSTVERRQTRRKANGEHVQLLVGNTQHRIVLRDVSVTGLGLSDCPELERGTKVAVKLNTGRLLSGIVVWAKNGRTGVRLCEVIRHNDPILSASDYLEPGQ